MWLNVWNEDYLVFILLSLAAACASPLPWVAQTIVVMYPSGCVQEASGLCSFTMSPLSLRLALSGFLRIRTHASTHLASLPKGTFKCRAFEPATLANGRVDGREFHALRAIHSSLQEAQQHGLVRVGLQLFPGLCSDLESVCWCRIESA
jgi:hypothetical protein